jgi:hypothetical protein
MRMTKSRVVAALGGLVLAGSVGAVGLAQQQRTPLFRMDCGTGGSAYPLCGFSALANDDSSLGVHFRRSRIPGGSPSGSDAVQFDLLPVAAHLQHYLGWRLDRPPAVPQGASRYLRFRIRLRSPINYTAHSGGWGAKFVILGDTCESDFAPTRVIVNLRDAGGNYGAAILSTEQNIAGPPSRVDSPGLAPDVWHSVQVKVRSSSSASANDAMLFFYLDGGNASESRPTGQSSGPFRLRTDGWSGACSMGFGYFAGTTLRAGSNVSFQVADFEYDDEFDSSWHLGGGGTGVTPPTAPSNVRIVVGP